MMTVTHLSDLTAAIDAIPASEVGLVRPADLATHQVLYRLAHEAGATVQRGAISLAGADWPAWLALGPDGGVLVAAVIGETGEGREAQEARP